MSGRRKISRWGRERDPKCAPLDGHARVLQREASRAHRRHGRRSVALGDGALEPNDERELLVARDDRHERALGEVPVSDLAAVRRPDPPRLPHARGREEVVQVKAPILVLAAIRALRVNLPAQRRRRDRLRLPAREQRATVRAREEATFRGDRTDRVNVAPVLSTPVPADHVADRARLHAPARQTNIRRLRGKRREVAASVDEKNERRERRRNERGKKRSDPILRETSANERGSSRGRAGASGRVREMSGTCKATTSEVPGCDAGVGRACVRSTRGVRSAPSAVGPVAFGPTSGTRRGPFGECARYRRLGETRREQREKRRRRGKRTGETGTEERRGRRLVPSARHAPNSSPRAPPSPCCEPSPLRRRELVSARWPSPRRARRPPQPRRLRRRRRAS